jgi:hypothetical protein
LLIAATLLSAKCPWGKGIGIGYRNSSPCDPLTYQKNQKAWDRESKGILYFYFVFLPSPSANMLLALKFIA